MQNKKFPDNEKIKKGQSGYTKWLNMVLILADDNQNRKDEWLPFHRRTHLKTRSDLANT